LKTDLLRRELKNSLLKTAESMGAIASNFQSQKTNSIKNEFGKNAFVTQRLKKTSCLKTGLRTKNYSTIFDVLVIARLKPFF
jgi:hypothetical protein